jgi:hypothetical protein
MDTHSDRIKKLAHMIKHGGSAARHSALPKKNVFKLGGNSQQRNNEEERKVKEKMKAALRAACGLDSRGCVKKFTKVLVDFMPAETKLEDHPFFAEIPFMACRETTNTSWFRQLAKIEQRIKATLPENEMTTKHKHGANMGVNFGLTVEGGGTDSHKGQRAWSGAVHQRGKAAKHRVELQMQLITCIKGLLEESFGKTAWHRRLLCLTTRLNEETGEDRTIPGLPLSGPWLTNDPAVERIHCDRNAVGATFLLTTSDVEGAELALLSPTSTMAKQRIAPGQILAGTWANHPHCNVNVQGSKTTRTSWTLCLDGRVFCKTHRFQRKVVEK